KQKAVSVALKPELLERIKSARRSPLIEGEEVTFVYHGAAKRVEVVGDFTGWGMRSHVMQAVPGTDAVKLYTLRFPKSSRVEYKLIADGEWMLDPLNPDKNDNGVGGENSFFTMPEYRASPFVNAEGGWRLPPGLDAKAVFKNWARHGTGGAAINFGDMLVDIQLEDVPSDRLGSKRTIAVYFPRGYRKAQQTRYPVLYVQDGSDYIRRAHAVEIADKMVAQGKVAPFIIVFIDPLDRMKEYWANDAFADFMAKELVPFVDARFRTVADREHRALLGASLGGVISVWTALRHPAVFARVGGQSTAFWIDDERVVTALAALDEEARRNHPFRFYFDTGRLESVLDTHRRVQVMLAAKGYPVTYRESESGHNYTTWRDRLADAYLALWGELKTVE
ncbi:MAG: hypothetical protein H0T60_08630, partial [Acidobacteria bacterium]|nr:hypothetical protein [Acidobacteriota bacterium]